MAMAAIPFRPYTGVIDTSSKRYQTAKAMLDEGKATKSRAKAKPSWRNSACCCACWGRTPLP